MAIAADPPSTISPGSGYSPGILTSSLTPTFYWSPVSDATGYGLYIRDMTASGTPLIYPNASGITANPLTGSSFTIPSGILIAGHNYRWNMTSFVGATEGSAVSTVLYFQTPVSPPQTIYPSGGITVSSLTPTFSWNSASGATGYGLYIRDMTASGTPLIYPNASGITASPLTGSSFTIPSGILIAGHNYRWNMTSFVGSTEGTSVSTVLYFQTPAAVVVSTPIITSSSSGSSVGTVTANPQPTVSTTSGNPIAGNPTPVATSDNTSQTTTISSENAPWGTSIGSFKGVTAYSNGSHDYDSPRGSYGLNYQCAEYVTRYYSLIYSVNLAGQNAYQFFANASSRGLASFQNGGNVAPQSGDILCFGGGSGGFGHVAIISDVNSGGVTVIQENVTESVRDAAYAYALTVSGGTYTVDASRLGSTYYCQGWLRKSAATTLSSSGSETVSSVKSSSISSSKISDNTLTQNQTTSSAPQIATLKTAVSPVSQAVTYSLTLQTFPSEGGTISGGGTYDSGSSKTATATPNRGFIFDNWSENGKIVSREPAYNLTMNDNHNLTAHFKREPLSLILRNQNQDRLPPKNYPPNFMQHTNRLHH